MIESVTYKNFKVLRDATLPLGRFTLIVGPNGSGKSAALAGLYAMSGRYNPDVNRDLSLGSGPPESSRIQVTISWDQKFGNKKRSEGAWFRGGSQRQHPHMTSEETSRTDKYLAAIRYFSFEPNRIGNPTSLEPNAVLDDAGTNLAIVLDRLRDQWPERFEALNCDLERWIPEFDRVLFETPSSGNRALMLRNKRRGEAVHARGLSEGTRSALALLTISHLPDPPSVVEIEEPDRGIHPRLLRDVRDALYRLAYPENFNDKRAPVQVIATTHSPYFVDLFKDHPEEIVIAHKKDGWGTFERLSDRPDIDDLLNGGALGEIWYSGILGGVPAET